MESDPRDAAGAAFSELSESRRLDRVRRDFVANVSHELKTPVATIRALAETAATALGSDDLDTAILFVDRLGHEATRLADLVTDLLDLSRVEAMGELHRGSVDLDAIVRDAAEQCRQHATAKGLALVVHATPTVIEADPSQLAMALKNVVDNAIRYSESGTIELCVAPGPKTVAISISDEGIGIPEDEIPRIFERFYRVDKARSRSTGGTGLGLAIVKHVIENHSGEVAVRSQLGVGSTVTLRLPVVPIPAP
jgi:signal transduction histidine kinase